MDEAVLWRMLADESSGYIAAALDCLKAIPRRGLAADQQKTDQKTSRKISLDRPFHTCKVITEEDGRFGARSPKDLCPLWGR